MLHLPNATRSLLQQKTHRFCTLWKITRRDAVILRFTDHNTKITYNSETYTPVGNFNSSAIKKSDSLEGQNAQFVGAVTDTAITAEQLREGRYRGAEVYQYVVDWKYPFAGALRTARYFVKKTKFNREYWEAEIEGLTFLLNLPVGDLFTRDCRHTLGDSGCKFNLPSLTLVGAVVNDDHSGSRLSFSASHAGFSGKAEHYYKFGKILWTTGDNDNLVSEIMTSSAAISTTIGFSVLLRTTQGVTVGDEFTISPGCDKVHTTCTTKFANRKNFGGYEFIPGLDKVLQII